MMPYEIVSDPDNQKYRRLVCEAGILEYTREGSSIFIDWVQGRDLASMLVSMIDAEGPEVDEVSGYVSDKLGELPIKKLWRFAQIIAGRVGEGWQARVQLIAGRTYIVLNR